MKQNGSSVRLFDRSKDGQAFMQIVRIADIFQALEPCVPNIIRVLDIKYDLRPERVLEYLVHIAKKENVGILQRFEKKSWAVFNAIMSLIDDKAVLLVQLDKTIFPGSGAGEIAVSRDTSISELKLTNCVFYDDALRKMSPKQINIDFPETKLGHLELSLNSIFDSSRIVTPGKCHTLSVAIGDVMRNYVYAEHGHQKTYQATDNEPVIESRCAVNFHISIKCKELQSLSVSDVNVF
ncbi:hypothetical protein BD408DRAFT_418310 [Parasitella parasitica]|nr:hypothetical protein BD408DRAFT_418310 [Parasitella parasitica]